MKRLNIYDFVAVLLFFAFVCGSILTIRKSEQRESTNLKEQNFPVWKTIELGSFKDAHAIHEALESNDFGIEFWANDIIFKTPMSHKKISLNLALVSASQLGFNNHVPYQEINKRAQELGLIHLPAEAGPQLRLQYKDQPANEWLHVAMEPIIASDGDPTVFDIMHYDHPVHDNNNPAHGDHYGLQLCSSSVRSDVLWSPSSRWIFATN